MTITAKCDHCGAQIVFEEDQEATICKYCDSVNAIPDIIKKSDNTVEAPQLRKVIPDIQFAANHQISTFNSQGGYIWITKNELYFKPHKYNIGNLSKRYIRIQDICGYSKDALTKMSIYTRKGYVMELAVWQKDEIINALESRRCIYYQSKGLPIPPLTGGSLVHESMNTSNSIEASNMSNSGCMIILIGLLSSTLLTLLVLIIIL